MTHAVRPLEVVGRLREQAQHRTVVDFEASRRAQAQQEQWLEFKDWATVGVDDNFDAFHGWHNNWQNVALNAEWELYPGEPRATAGYFRDRWGFVHLKGYVENPAHEANYMFAVPDPLAPAQHTYFMSSYKTTQTKGAGQHIADLGTTLVTYGCIVAVGGIGTPASGAVQVVNYFDTGAVTEPIRSLTLDGFAWQAWNAGQVRT